MNTTLRIQLAAAAAILAVTPVAASAEQTAYTESPVAIRSVSNDSNFFEIPYGAQRLYTNGVGVNFVNNEKVAATRIEFTVDRDGATQRISAKGTYAPGTAIDTEIARDTTTEPIGHLTVTVSKVDFADGTSWTPAAGHIASAGLQETASR